MNTLTIKLTRVRRVWESTEPIEVPLPDDVDPDSEEAVDLANEFVDGLEGDLISWNLDDEDIEEQDWDLA